MDERKHVTVTMSSLCEGTLEDRFQRWLVEASDRLEKRPDQDGKAKIKIEIAMTFADGYANLEVDFTEVSVKDSLGKVVSFYDEGKFVTPKRFRQESLPYQHQQHQGDK